MKGLLVALIASLFVLTGCGPSRADLEGWVKGELQKYVQSDPTLSQYAIVVERVELVESGKNIYDGVGFVRFQGGEKTVPLEVTADRDRRIYQTKPSAFDFVAQAEMQAAQKAMEAQMAEAEAEAKKIEAEMAAAHAEMEAANNELEAAMQSAEAEMEAANAEFNASMDSGN